MNYSNFVQKALKEAGIPVIHIETDYGDQDFHMRPEAFLEMIRE